MIDERTVEAISYRIEQFFERNRFELLSREDIEAKFQGPQRAIGHALAQLTRQGKIKQTLYFERVETPHLASKADDVRQGQVAQ